MTWELDYYYHWHFSQKQLAAIYKRKNLILGTNELAMLCKWGGEELLVVSQLFIGNAILIKEFHSSNPLVSLTRSWRPSLTSASGDSPCHLALQFHFHFLRTQCRVLMGKCWLARNRLCFYQANCRFKTVLGCAGLLIPCSLHIRLILCLLIHVYLWYYFRIWCF